MIQKPSKEEIEALYTKLQKDAAQGGYS